MAFRNGNWKTPNLPGYVDNSNRAGNKQQTLHYSAAGAGVKYPKPSDNLPAYAKPNAKFDASVVRSKAKVASAERVLLGQIARGESDPKTRGAPVVTVTAYWKEILAIGTVDYRYRIFKISIDLDDFEIQFSEQKKNNSGLPEGAFLKKNRIWNEKTKRHLMPADLVVGKNISVYARTFHIYSCDSRSRGILRSAGIACPPDEDPPEDPAKKFKRERQEMAGGHAANAAFKKYNEAQLGAAIGATSKLGDFIEFNDHAPLRFFAVWYDERLYGKLNRYTVDFFLEDRTFRIRDIIEDNSGTDQFHNVYKRATIAKPGEYKVDSNSIGRQKENAQIYDVTDLYINNKIRLFGRDLLLTKCNMACRDFYKMRASRNPDLFKEQPPNVVLPEDVPAAKPKRQEPVKYLGGVCTFGSQEDSMQSCLSLHPIHIKDDPEKVKSNQNHALSFGAELVSNNATDEGRFFAIKFYLFDDTVAIFETAKKNSGIVPGKFLRRGKVHNPDTGKYFHFLDFYVGAQLTIYKYKFRLVDLDAFTMNYAMNRPGKFKWADIERLIKTMRAVCHAGNATIGGKSQATAKGKISEKDFLKFLQEQCRMAVPEAICCASFFFKKQELFFEELREFNNVQDKHLTRLISADTCDTILEDAKLDEQQRNTKRLFARVSQGFIDDKLAFISICESNQTELKNLDRSGFAQSLLQASYSSNIPYTKADIAVMVGYFFPRGTEGERAGPNKEWLSVHSLEQFLFPEVVSANEESHTTVKYTTRNGITTKEYVTDTVKDGVAMHSVHTLSSGHVDPSW